MKFVAIVFSMAAMAQASDFSDADYLMLESSKKNVPTADRIRPFIYQRDGKGGLRLGTHYRHHNPTVKRTDPDSSEDDE